MSPSVSVILTTYNRKAFVTEALESVLHQDFTDYEIIVIDDGSTDGTETVISNYKGVRYVYQKNQGVSHARNQGLSLAQGKFVCFLDSDDLWLPKKLSTQVTVMQKNPEAKVTYTDEIWIRKGRRVNPMRKHQKYSGRIFEKCLARCIISPSSVMITREVFDHVGLFDTSLPVCEDYDLWLRIASRFPVLFINQKIIIKRGGHEDQLSHRLWGNDRFRVRALEKIIDDPLLEEENRNLAIQELIKKSTVLEGGFRKRGKVEEADHYRNVIRKYQQRLVTP